MQTSRFVLLILKKQQPNGGKSNIQLTNGVKVWKCRRMGIAVPLMRNWVSDKEVSVLINLSVSVCLYFGPRPGIICSKDMSNHYDDASRLSLSSYLVLLLCVFILKFKFLCLQLAHPFPQFLSFFPVSARKRKWKHFIVLTWWIITPIGRIIFYSSWKASEWFWPYLSLSSFIWSIFNSLRRSLRIFFFFSLSVCLFGPVCVC